MLFYLLQINHRCCLKGHLCGSGNFVMSLFKGTNCYMQRHKSVELLNTRKKMLRGLSVRTNYLLIHKIS